MKADKDKTREELIAELVALRSRPSEASATPPVEDLFDKMFQNPHVMIAYLDSDLRFVRVNRPYAESLEYTQQGLVGKSLFEVVHDPEVHDNFRAAADTGAPFLAFGRPAHNPNTQKFWDLSLQPVKDSFGRVTGLAVFMVDSTRHVMVEELLRISEQRYRSLFESANDGIIIVNLEGIILEVNRIAAERLGCYGMGELLGMDMQKIVAPEFRGGVAERIRRIQSEGRLVFVSEHLRKNGTSMPVESSSRIIDYDGNPAIMSIVRDITDQKAMENELLKYKDSLERLVRERTQELLTVNATLLREIDEKKAAQESIKTSEARFRAIFEKSNVGISLISMQRVFLLINPTLETMLGYAPGELAGRNVSEISVPEDDIQNIHLYRGMIEGDYDHFHMEKRYIKKDGSLLWGSLTVTLIRDPRGEPEFIVGMVEDITERKSAEDALRERQEMLRKALDEKDVLMHEIHHRTKNNMQVIASLLNLQSARLSDSMVREMFQETRNRIIAMALVHDKLYQSEDLSYLDLHGYVTELVGSLLRGHDTARGHINIRYEIERIPVMIDLIPPCGLIINELVSNAFKYAFPDDKKGTITISARSIPDNIIEFRFADDGIGLPEEVDPYQAKSLGLGLVTSLVIKQLKGTIDIRRSPGTEIVFSFTNREFLRASNRLRG